MSDGKQVLLQEHPPRSPLDVSEISEDEDAIRVDVMRSYNRMDHLDLELGEPIEFSASVGEGVGDDDGGDIDIDADIDDDNDDISPKGVSEDPCRTAEVCQPDLHEPERVRTQEVGHQHGVSLCQEERQHNHKDQEYRTRTQS